MKQDLSSGRRSDAAGPPQEAVEVTIWSSILFQDVAYLKFRFVR